MGKDIFDHTDLGEHYFERANDIMEYDIQSIIFNGPKEKLKQTQYTQPAIYIVSVILGELLKEKGFTPNAVAGHSLGEYSALAVANAFDFETGLSLVKVRAENMAKAGATQEGAMSGEWKAPLTFNWTVILAPDAFAESITDSTASGEPEITTCPGEL